MQKLSQPIVLNPKQSLSMPEISKVLIQVCEQLGKNTELHVHFIINSVIVDRDANNSSIRIGGQEQTNNINTNNGGIVGIQEEGHKIITKINF